MNPNTAELVRISIREAGSAISDLTPRIPPGGGTFDVVIEAEGGSTLIGTNAPYTLIVRALDFTDGTDPGGNFNFTVNQNFSPANVPPWPAYGLVHTVDVPAAVIAARRNHFFKYFAALLAPDATNPTNIVSFAESPLFMLTGAL